MQIMSQIHDVIVVGSGASAVHAAQSLIDAGHTVLMLDVGIEDTIYAPLIPDQPFSVMRRTDHSQHRFLLGDDFEGIPLGELGTGPQLTPPRQYIVRDTARLAPIHSGSFSPIESLAVGGLGGAWGAVSFPYLDSELKRSGLFPAALRPHYDIVARRIGISGPQMDDLQPFHGGVAGLQPPLGLDHNAAIILARYQQRRDLARQEGVYLGRPLRAVLTQPLNGRRPHAYHDMDFWSNNGGSVYRPALTLYELRASDQFRYERPYLVERFLESGAGTVSVYARSLVSQRLQQFVARRVIIAAGSFGTTRIVLRSLGQYDVRVPLTCNAHTFVPCLHLGGLGTPSSERRQSLTQLTMIYDQTGTQEHLVQAQLYSYRSLLLFRLLKESSLSYREGLRIMRALSPGMVIWLIQHEDVKAEGRYCVLRRGEDRDRLELVYQTSEEQKRHQRAHERVMMRWFRKLGCWPVKTVRPNHGGSIHYGSQLPFSHEERPLTTAPSGRLHGTHHVYIGDGAAFAYLPAKGLTLTLMANGNRIAANVSQSLKSKILVTEGSPTASSSMST